MPANDSAQRRRWASVSGSSGWVPSGRSDGIVAALAGADPDDLLDVADPHLAVADLVGAGRLHDGVAHPLDVVVAHHRLDPHLGDEVDVVLRAPVRLGVTAL